MKQLKYMFMRWKYRLFLAWNSAEELSRRAKTEMYLIDCAAGKKPLPDKEKCMELALALGVPSWWNKK